MIMDFVILIIFLYCISINNISAFILVCAVITLYYVKYYRLKHKIKTIEHTYNEKLAIRNNYFISLLTHDLKTPLIAQLRSLELLNKEFFGSVNNEQHEIIDNITTSCKENLSLIEMIVKTYNIENYLCKPEYEFFNFSEMLKNCFEEVSKEAGEKNLTIEYQSTNSDTFIEADKSAIKRVISNLLSNAISYSTLGGLIKVNVKSDSKNLMFNVSGMGLGSRYWSNTEYNYTTIGLNIKMYLCKKIIEFHKGKIFSQKDKNYPNSFTFVIPKYASSVG